MSNKNILTSILTLTTVKHAHIHIDIHLTSESISLIFVRSLSTTIFFDDSKNEKLWNLSEIY